MANPRISTKLLRQLLTNHVEAQEDPVWVRGLGQVLSEHVVMVWPGDLNSYFDALFDFAEDEGIDLHQSVAEFLREKGYVEQEDSESGPVVLLFDEELVKGTNVETEHTEDVRGARKIALEHLKEDPKYYSKLLKLLKNPFVSAAQRRACYAKKDPNWDCKEWDRSRKSRRSIK